MSIFMSLVAMISNFNPAPNMIHESMGIQKKLSNEQKLFLASFQHFFFTFYV